MVCLEIESCALWHTEREPFRCMTILFCVRILSLYTRDYRNNASIFILYTGQLKWKSEVMSVLSAIFLRIFTFMGILLLLLSRRLTQWWPFYARFVAAPIEWPNNE